MQPLTSISATGLHHLVMRTSHDGHCQCCHPVKHNGSRMPGPATQSGMCRLMLSLQPLACSRLSCCAVVLQSSTWAIAAGYPG